MEKNLLNLDEYGNFLYTAIKNSAESHHDNKAIKNSAESHHDNFQQSSVLKTEKQQTILCKYISGTFSVTEKNYSTHEKETLACLRTLKKWKLDLLQTRFELRTDSKYVVGFWKYKLKEDHCRGRLIRWQLELHRYCPYIKHIKSENNSFADTLTREWKEL